MNERGKYWFIAISLLLFLVAVMLWYANTHSTFRPVDSDYSVERKHTVTRVEILSLEAGEGVDLQFSEEGKWILNQSLFANESAVAELLDILSRLTIRQPVSLDIKDSVDLLFKSQGKRVNVYIQDHHVKIGKMRAFPYERILQAFMVAGDSPDGAGTYMKKIDAKFAFMIHIPAFDSGLAKYFSTSVSSWRDPVIIDLTSEEIEWVRLDFFNNEPGSFTLKQSAIPGSDFYDHEGNLLKGKIGVDSARVSRFLSSFNDLHYESLLDSIGNEVRKNMMNDTPWLSLSVKPVGREEMSFTVYRRYPPDEVLISGTTQEFDPNRFYMELNEGEYALAQFYVFNRVFRPLSFFIKEQ